MKEYVLKNRVKTISKQVLRLSHNQKFDGSMKKSDFHFLFSYVTLRFPTQTILEQKKPVVTEKLEWLKQPKSIWNAFNVCFALSNFQCCDQEFQFSTPMLLYKCEVSNCVFLEKNIIQHVVMQK